MKKRIIAFALCFVMLLGCLGMSGDVLTDTAPLYDRLIAAQTADEFDAITAAATEEEIAALTDEQLVEISNRYAAILGEDAAEPITYASSSVNNVGPLVKKDAVQTKARLAKAMSADVGQNGPFEPSDAGHPGLFLNKNVSDNGDGTYKLTLESFVTGEVKITQEKLPADIVLVLDTSASMDKYITLEEVKSNDEVIKISEKLDKKYGADGTVYTWGNRAVKWGKPTKLEIGSGWVEKTNEPDQWVYNASGTKGRWETLEYGLKFTSVLYDCNFYISKLNAMKIAVKNFVDQVQDNATDGVEHTISIVDFSSSEDSKTVLTPTPVSKDSDTTEIINAVDRLSASGGTQAGKGMQLARDIIENENKIDQNRKSNKVVVMFTDGEPGDYGFKDDGISVANVAIDESWHLKNDDSATVYTIGVFESGLNASNDKVTVPSSQVSKYMHYVSSNFKDAKDMDTPGTPTYPAGNDNYFLLADSASKMNDIFSGITDKVSGGASMQLGAETVLRDIVTSDFELVSTDMKDVHVYTADYQGYDEADGATRKFTEKKEYNGCKVSISGNKVEVTGFDYSSDKNCVTDTKNADGSTNHSGKKLIVEFDIKVSDSCMGGGWFDTNDNASGIYKTADDKDAVGKFPVPNVNVPRKTFDLKIQKSAAEGTTIDPSQTFVFTVKGTDEHTNGVNTQVIIEGAKSVTLKDLPVGNYTITEDTGWSWRYTPDQVRQTVSADSTTAQKTVTFVNSLDNNKWLSFLNRVTNVFGISNAS